jgi:hypothetical protein
LPTLISAGFNTQVAGSGVCDTIVR